MGDGHVTARQRLAPEVRRRQLIDAARALVLERGYLPLPMEALADRAGVSKGLIYGYFPTQHDLFNAVLQEEMDVLCAAGLPAAVDEPDLDARARGCADLYLRHVSARGPIIHYLLRDTYMARRLAPEATRLRDRILRSFARAARRQLRLPAGEAAATAVMIAAIPEEMGRLVWQGDLKLERARSFTSDLVASSIAALRPA